MSDIVDPREPALSSVGPHPRFGFRPMRRDDIAAGLRLCRASRWNQTREDWEFFLSLNPRGSLVAVTGTGEVVGSIATLRYGTTFTWIAMVLVDPAHRRAGVASGLLGEALALVDDGPTLRLDATPLGHEMYLRAGFCEDYRLQRMERAPRTFLTEAEKVGGPRARRLADEDIEDVIRLDREVFGADRSALLNAFRHRAQEYAWVVGQDRLDGFLLGRHGQTFEHLGPLVARDERTARELVTTCLAAHPNRPFIIDVPPHGLWTQWLESCQFVVQRHFARMYRGDRSYREQVDLTFAIAGPEFG